MRILCVGVCLSAHGQGFVLESVFWQQQRSSRFGMCECVRPFLCVLMRAGGNKNRGCPLGSSTCLCMNTLSTGEVLTHTHVKGLTCRGIRLLSCAMLCSGMWCEADLGKCVCIVCLPSMEFMRELRDQTAAEGVCLVAMLVSLYPVGQYNWRFLSHQLSNSCHPAARCLSKCVRRAREGRGFWRKHWVTETDQGDMNQVLSEAYTFLLHPFVTGICTLPWRDSFKMSR